MKEISVRSGALVPVRVPKEGIKEVSLPQVGHELERGAVIVDGNGNEIPPTELRARRVVNGIPFQAKAVDPGKQYPVCFLLETPGHLAMLFKA